MSWNNINFDDKKIKKSDFYNKNKKIFNINDIDVNKILVSKKEKYGKYNSFKHFIGYNDNDVIRPLYLGLSQMTGYINEFDKNKNKNKNTITMSLLVKDKRLLKNYNKIWKKIELDKKLNTDFDSKSVYGNDDKYIKAKIKTHEVGIITNFYNKNGSKKIPEEKIPCKCLSIIVLDSVLYAYEKYHPKIFFEECKYKQERIKTKNYVDRN